jgi:glycosyltransferase involved in cell wall biosynthesis
VRALIDAHMLGAHETGNETYIAGLLSGLAELGSRHFAAVARGGIIVPGHDTWVLSHRSNVGRLLRDLPGMAAQLGASLVHSTYVAPPNSPVPTVVTVHDVSFIRYPSSFSLRDRAMLSTAVPFSAHRAAAVIVPSRHAREEVVELLHLPADRVYVTPEACGAEFAPVAGPVRAAALARYGVDGPYVLAVGNLQPRKNLPRLLRAWRMLRADGLLQGCRLVLAGGYHGRREPLDQLIADLSLAADVLLTGYVEHQDLPALYAGARVFVYPSLYEGFGLPVLEAMACGVPVACSRAASLPEVAGEAAALFDPTDTDALAATLGALLADDHLRAALVRRGLARCRRFSWRACALATLNAYQAAAP